MSVDPPEPRQVLKPETILELQRSAEQVFVHNLVAEYAVRLVMATRTPPTSTCPTSSRSSSSASARARPWADRGRPGARADPRPDYCCRATSRPSRST
jgi:MoxR-like ATPase